MTVPLPYRPTFVHLSSKIRHLIVQRSLRDRPTYVTSSSNIRFDRPTRFVQWSHYGVTVKTPFPLLGRLGNILVSVLTVWGLF